MFVRIIFFLYAIAAYVGFLLIFLYAIGFLGNFIVPKSVDSETPGPIGTAIVVNTLLLLLFAVHHSVAARPAFKKWWTMLVPRPIERSTYVLMSDVLFALILWQWRPMTDVVWQGEHPAGRTILWALFGFGWVLVVASSFMIDHFDLFGLRHVYLHLKGLEYRHPPSWFAPSTGSSGIRCCSDGSSLLGALPK